MTQSTLKKNERAIEAEVGKNQLYQKENGKKSNTEKEQKHRREADIYVLT